MNKVLLGVVLAAVLATSALVGSATAAERGAFPASGDSRAKFQWAVNNFSVYCKGRGTGSNRFDDLPGWKQALLRFASKEDIIKGIRDNCIQSTARVR